MCSTGTAVQAEFCTGEPAFSHAHSLSGSARPTPHPVDVSTLAAYKSLFKAEAPAGLWPAPKEEEEEEAAAAPKAKKAAPKAKKVAKKAAPKAAPKAKKAAPAKAKKAAPSKAAAAPEKPWYQAQWDHYQPIVVRDSEGRCGPCG